jgi:hypothetical protein
LPQLSIGSNSNIPNGRSVAGFFNQLYLNHSQILGDADSQSQRLAATVVCSSLPFANPPFVQAQSIFPIDVSKQVKWVTPIGRKADEISEFLD